MTTKINKSIQQAADQSLIDGFTKHAALIPSLFIGGATTKTTDIVSTLQAFLAAAKSTAAAHVALKASVLNEKQLRAQNKQLVTDVVQTLRAMFSTQPTLLADFGLALPKKPVLTPQAKVVAAAKARATRQARGTKSKKQLAAITGDVTGIVVTPITAAPLPHPAAEALAPAVSATTAAAPAATKS